MPGIFDADGRVKLEHVSEVADIPEEFKEAADSFLNLSIIRNTSPKLQKTLYHMWQESGVPYMIEHEEFGTEDHRKKLPEGPRAWMRRGSRMAPHPFKYGVMQDRGFDPPDTINVKRDILGDVIAELAHGYEDGVLREPATGSRLLPQESLYERFIQGVDWLADKVYGHPGEPETVLDVLKEEHYGSIPDTTGQKWSPFWIDRDTGRVRKDVMAYEDPNLKRNQKLTRRAHEYVTHSIIEPWLYKRYQIENLKDELLRDNE